MRSLTIAGAAMACLGACTVANTSPGPDSGITAPARDNSNPLSCDQTLALDGTSSQSVSQSITVSTDSIGWCLQLIGLDNAKAELAATTANVSGMTSSFQLVIEDATGLPLIDSWDVSVGQDDSQTHANIEYTMPQEQDHMMILRARSLVGTSTTTLTATFFGPLED